MDAEALELSDGTFDAALCGLGLMYASEPEQAVQEMHRTLSHNGRAVAAVWGERRNNGWSEIFGIVDNVVQSDVCPLIFRLGSGKTLSTIFEASGFAKVRTRRLPVMLKYADEPAALTATVEAELSRSAAKRFDPATRQKVGREFLASVASFRQPDSSYEIPGEFVVVDGRKSADLS